MGMRWTVTAIIRCIFQPNGDKSTLAENPKTCAI